MAAQQQNRSPVVKPLYQQIQEAEESLMVKLEAAADVNDELVELREAQAKREARIQALGRAIAPAAPQENAPEAPAPEAVAPAAPVPQQSVWEQIKTGFKSA